MNVIGSDLKRVALLGLATLLIAGACGSGKVTLVAGTATPAPTAADTPTDVPTDTPTDTPTPAATPAPTPTPAASPTASATDTPAASATANPVSGICGGTTDQQSYFQQAAAAERFDVYCGALPAKWYLQTTQYTVPNGGQLTIQYKRFSGGQLDISEGAFCTTSAAACSPNVAVIGAGSFGGLAGSLDKLSVSPDVFVIYVAPGTSSAYTIKGTGVSQAEFVALAADMVKVPKS